MLKYFIIIAVVAYKILAHSLSKGKLSPFKHIQQSSNMVGYSKFFRVFGDGAVHFNSIITK